MTTTATIEGRALVLTVDGIDEPFTIPPLPGAAGEQITATYLAKSHPATSGDVPDIEMTEALVMATDGATKDAETGRWAPRAPDERTNWNRIHAELQLSEAQDVLMPALLWQTVLGGRGVTAYFESGGGDAGTMRGLLELVARLGIGGVQTSPSATVSALVDAELSAEEAGRNV